MRIVAMADLHLGFRRHPARIEGRNAREVDVEKAWAEAVEKAIDLAPDLVTIAGDVFHHPRVSMHAVKAFRDGLRMLSAHNIQVVVLEGNHDAAKTAEVLTPVIIPDDLEGVHTVHRPERLRIHTRDGSEIANVACFPYVDRGDGYSYHLEPDQSADLNILVMHAAVKGHAEGDTLPFFYGGDGKALDVGRVADDWDVVACGDYHTFTRLHPTRPAFYSGSLERTSSNVWQEDEEKGFVFIDTEEDRFDFIEVYTRPMRSFQLSELGESEVNADALNRAMGRLVDDVHLADFMVRLKVDEFPRNERQHIDWGRVRLLKEECLHFYLDLRYSKAEFVDIGDRRSRSGALSLAEEAVRFSRDSDPEAAALFLRYLGVEAEAEELAKAAP